MKAAKIIFTTCVWMVLVPVFAIAQTAKELEHTLVTGSYSPLSISAQTSSVSVLDFAEIQALNNRNLVDILKTIPGILVEEQGGPGGLTAVSIRGGEANFTLVLIDSIPVNDPTNSRGGGFDISNLDINNVERIEVIRGPQSAVYGSDALAGVINIITRRAGTSHQQFASVEAGEHDYLNYSLAAMGKSDKLAYAITASSRDAGNAVEGSHRQNDEANLRLGWQASSRHTLEVSYRYLDGDRSSYPEQSGGPEFALIDSLDISNYRDQTFAVNWQADFSRVWYSVLNAHQFKHKENYTSPGIFPFFEVPPNGAITDYERKQVQWINTLRSSDDYQLNVGADFRQENGESTGYLDLGFAVLPTDYDLERDTKAVFTEIHANVTAGLLLMASARYDSPEDFSSESTLKLGGRYDLRPDLSISANWGQAFKLPSFFALGHALVGNAELTPETADSWDVGITWNSIDNFDLYAAYFSNTYHDLIDFDAATFRFVNRKQVDSKGLELQVNWKPINTLTLSAHSSYTDLNLKNSDSQLLGRPEWRVGSAAIWQTAPNWDMRLDLQWSGEQYASSLYTGESVIEKLDDYYRLDWNISWQASDRLSIKFAVDNLLDERYYTAVGFQAPGRLMRLALNFSNAF